MKFFLVNFVKDYGACEVEQASTLRWLASYQNISDFAHYSKYGVSDSYVETRHFYAKGLAGLPHKGDALYQQESGLQPNLQDRGSHAQETIEEIFDRLYAEPDVAPCHINHVSCTHYQSPSAAQKFVSLNKNYSSTVVTHLYHMGCYAALPALRVAKAYVSDGAMKVDNVHTELCSFHLNRDIITAEQTIMNTLFADGAIKYSIVKEHYFKEHNYRGFEILALREKIVPNSCEEMSWKLGDNGFVMNLSKNVPILLMRQIETFARGLFTCASLDYEKYKDICLFAIHPGGPKIIELISRVLVLKPAQIEHSQMVLRKRGNMSSATLPHIWRSILTDNKIDLGHYVVTVAFGPGLTLTGALLKVC